MSARFATSDGTATASADYLAQSGTLSWADRNMAPNAFNITVIDDRLIEGDETVNLGHSPAPATLAIADNDVVVTVKSIPTLSNWGVSLCLAGPGP